MSPGKEVKNLLKKNEQNIADKKQTTGTTTNTFFYFNTKNNLSKTNEKKKLKFGENSTKRQFRFVIDSGAGEMAACCGRCECCCLHIVKAGNFRSVKYTCVLPGTA